MLLLPPLRATVHGTLWSIYQCRKKLGRCWKIFFSCMDDVEKVQGLGVVHTKRRRWNCLLSERRGGGGGGGENCVPISKLERAQLLSLLVQWNLVYCQFSWYSELALNDKLLTAMHRCIVSYSEHCVYRGSTVLGGRERGSSINTRRVVIDSPDTGERERERERCGTDRLFLALPDLPLLPGLPDHEKYGITPTSKIVKNPDNCKKKPVTFY